LLLTCLTTPVTAQFIVRGRNEADAVQRKTEMAQRKAEVALRKAQAVDILKGVVESAPEIQDTQTRVAVLIGALDLLWKHDDVYARANFIKCAAALSDSFASDASSRGERSQIRESMGVLLMAFARHDSQAAGRLLDKFQKLLAEVMKGNSLSPGERLSLAQASLDSDPVQSAALAAKVLEVGVPGTFPSYLNELEQRDPTAAASLFRVALSVLSVARVYNPVQVTVLSTYVFRESQMSVPTLRGGREGLPLEFGMFASPLSPPRSDLNQTLVSSYLATAGGYLNTEAIGLEQRSSPDAIHIALCFFLVKKLHAYADMLGLDNGQQWGVLDAKYSILAERAKVSESILSGLASIAQRIVTENTVFRFDGGEGAFAAAEKTHDTVQRAELLATGIRQLIDEGKYAEAVQKIADVPDEKFQEQLNTYRSFRMAEASLRKLDWDGFNAQLNRVVDFRLRTYLLLSAAVAANVATKKELSSEFLDAALAMLPRIDEADTRAAALVATTGIVYSGADSSFGLQALNEVVKAINRTDHYDGSTYGVTLEAPKYKVSLSIPNSDLSRCFEQAAKRDWQGSLAAAQGINSKALRSQAYIAVCRYPLM
jgi:hypothetical protein